MAIFVFGLSNVCVLLDSVDGQMLGEVMPGVTGETNNNQSINLLDKCFLTQSSTPTNILDFVEVDSGNGTMITFRQKFDNDVKQTLTNRFAEIGSSSNGTNTSLENNEAFAKLLRIIKENPLDATYVVDYAALSADAMYTAIGSDSTLSSLAATTALHCLDVNLTAEGPPPLGGRSVSGISAVDTEMTKYGTAIPSTQACGKPVACTPPSSICEAGNKYLQLKHDLRGKNVYKCGYFEDSSGADCDPTVGTGPARCLHTDAEGKKHLKASLRDCSFDQLVAQYASFETSIKADLRRIDDASASTKVGIQSGLNKAVTDNLLRPIDGIVSNVNCNFMTEAYQGVVDGVCFHFVIGLNKIATSYVACAVLALVLLIFSYAIWRRNIDNVNAWEKTNKAPLHV